MKRSDLITSTFKRTTTVDEQDYLQHLLKAAPTPRKRLLKAAMNVLVLWGFSMLGLLLASGLLSYLANYNSAIASLSTFSGLKEFAIAVTGLYALFSTKKWLDAWANPYPLILQDLQDKQVVDESYQVQAVCRFQEPELGGFIYFLKISEQHVFVLYDYQSQDCADSELRINKTLTLTKAMCCEQYIGQGFSGEKVALTATYPLTLAPEKWPLSETWLATPWSTLAHTFSQK